LRYVFTEFAVASIFAKAISLDEHQCPKLPTRTEGALDAYRQSGIDDIGCPDIRIELSDRHPWRGTHCGG
jgi:hypothetical protein